MTREEAIRELREDKALYETDNCHAGDGSPDGDLLEALDMAIEALKKQPTIPMFKESEEAYKAWTGEEMGELVKREDVIRTMCRDCAGETYPNCYCTDVKLFEEIPSADRPHGEWIEMGENEDTTHNIKCNQCGQGYQTRGHAHSLNTREKYKFCPNCGAKMGGDTK